MVFFRGGCKTTGLLCVAFAMSRCNSVFALGSCLGGQLRTGSVCLSLKRRLEAISSASTSGS